LGLSLQNVPDYDVEHSEVLLYYVHVLEELGESSEALAQLDIYAKERSIVDKIAISEHRGKKDYTVPFKSGSFCTFFVLLLTIASCDYSSSVLSAPPIQTVTVRRRHAHMACAHRSEPRFLPVLPRLPQRQRC